MNGAVNIKRVLTAFIFSALSTAVLFAVLAAVCTVTGLDGAAVRVMTFAVSVLCVFLWSLISARGVQKGGLVHGGCVGLLYAAVFAALSLLCGGAVSAHTATTVCAVVLAGILGGVIGINSGG